MIDFTKVEQLSATQEQIDELMVQELQMHNWTISCAESCTGGLLAGKLINVSGASDIINESYITYSNEAKNRLVGVPFEVLDTLGAVSFETAAYMAAGVTKAANASVGIGVTGVAGPTGGTKEKPVGLVYIGICIKNKVYVCECHFKGSRLEVRNQSVDQALALTFSLIHPELREQYCSGDATDEMPRYSVIMDKNPREIVLLRGKGCAYRQCSFCDYHLDYSLDANANFICNKEALEQVTGRFGKLEVINSGSFVELDEKTLALIREVCLKKEIKELHFECHYLYKEKALKWKQYFTEKGIKVLLKLGVESFDYVFREQILKKGIKEMDPAVICKDFDEICLLFGFTGQTKESMISDIEIALKEVQRVCINIFVNNSKELKADENVIRVFKEEVLPLYEKNERVDILLHNTDFGVGL